MGLPTFWRLKQWRIVSTIVQSKNCIRSYHKLSYEALHPLVLLKTVGGALLLCFLICFRLYVGTDTLFSKFWSICWLLRLGNVCGCSNKLIFLKLLFCDNLNRFLYRLLASVELICCLKYLVLNTSYLKGTEIK